MADVSESDLDNDHWGTSSGVRDYLDIPQQGDPRDVETFIETATDTVQAWWKEATDGDIPDDLPTATDIPDDHPLLQRATELQAASEAHEAVAQNFRAEEDEGQSRHVYLERRARSKFEDWVTVNGYGETDTTQSQGADLPSSGRSDSLIDLGD